MNRARLTGVARGQVKVWIAAAAGGRIMLQGSCYRVLLKPVPDDSSSRMLDSLAASGRTCARVH